MGTDFFVEDAPAVGVREENMYLEWPDGRRIGMPLRVGRLTSAGIANALNAYDHGNVFDFPRQKRPRKPRGDVAEG